MTDSRKPLIFIVYEGFEAALAAGLQSLMRGWGYEVFQCRQPDRTQEFDSKAFRDELRNNIRKCDLVLLLLSREFRWSGYCQAEIGATMALEKPFIAVMVPPATADEVNDIAVALQGIQFLNAGSPDFIAKLHGDVIKALHENKDSLRNLISRLQEVEKVDVSAFVPTQPADDGLKRDQVEQVIKDIEKRYQLRQPEKSLVSSWPGLSDELCKESIIGNMVESLTAPGPETRITLVGVSLKFSLYFIQEALERISRRKASISGKTLHIRLIYMDHQSHILHALNDTFDMDSIRQTLGGAEWQKMKVTWKGFCGDTIQLSEPMLYRIDYIPPRVGILIEDGRESLLYAGRCAFNQAHLQSPVFALEVGENEYILYKSSGAWNKKDPDHKVIDQFRKCVHAYMRSDNNSGVTPVWESSPWVGRLREYIDEACAAVDSDAAQEPSQITFISGTNTRFQELVVRAVLGGARVVTYVRDSGAPAKRAKIVHDKLKRELGAQAAKKVEQHRYRHPATFRAVVIGDAAIGLQMYINAEAGGGEPIRKLPLCFIVTPCSKHFAKLKHWVLTFADGDPLAGEVLQF